MISFFKQIFDLIARILLHYYHNSLHSSLLKINFFISFYWRTYSEKRREYNKRVNALPFILNIAIVKLFDKAKSLIMQFLYLLSIAYKNLINVLNIPTSLFLTIVVEKTGII